MEFSFFTGEDHFFEWGMTGWYRVVAVTAPWMTTEYPFCSQDQSGDGPMDFQGLNGILGAGGIVPAGSGQPRRNDPLVEADRQDE